MQALSSQYHWSCHFKNIYLFLFIQVCQWLVLLLPELSIKSSSIYRKPAKNIIRVRDFSCINFLKLNNEISNSVMSRIYTLDLNDSTANFNNLINLTINLHCLIKSYIATDKFITIANIKRLTRAKHYVYKHNDCNGRKFLNHVIKMEIKPSNQNLSDIYFTSSIPKDIWNFINNLFELKCNWFKPWLVK